MKKSNRAGTDGVTIQLNLIGLVVFSIGLVATATLVTYGLLQLRSPGGGNADHDQASSTSGILLPLVEEKNPPPWGQWVVHDIDLEQPEEYVAYETATNQVETWKFEGMTAGQVRAAMQSSGLAAKEIDRALSPPLLASAGPNTVVIPDEELVYSMAPPVRAKLYGVLARFTANEFMHFPFCFHTNSFETCFGDGKLDADTRSRLKQLMYLRGGTECFSDLAVLLRQIPDAANRLKFVKALSSQSAVLVRIHIWPDTDIDKLIGYWQHGLQEKDIRPLLESIRSVPGGSSMSILYFLPQFARQRLYTYPMPSQVGDPAMDCHWSTMNFFNETPDNRFADPKYTSAYLAANYYEIAKPTAYGDIVLILDDEGRAVHSAVYLASDIVFTKNGNNFAQPWMLMRLGDLVAEYTADAPARAVIYRSKNW